MPTRVIPRSRSTSPPPTRTASHVRHLTHYTGGAVNAFAGSYSPNGRKIVLRLEDHGVYWLYKMRPDGSHLKPIVSLGTMKPRVSDWGPRS